MLATERIIHLSHTDLDGFGSQFMTAQAFYNCAFYNCDYNFIDQTLTQIVRQVKLECLTNKPVKLILITDLNLTMKQADWLTDALSKVKNAPKIQLLDHHITGKLVSEKYDWYHLDISVCATRLTWQWICQFLPNQTIIDRLDKLSSLINVTDMWIQGHTNFNTANLMADLIFEQPWYPPNMEELGRTYKFHLIERLFNGVEKGGSVMQLERSLYDIKLAFLKQQGLSESLLIDTDISLEHKFYHLVFQELSSVGIDTISIDNYTVAVFYAWTGNLFQHVSSMILHDSKNIDITLRVNSQGKLSLRAAHEKYKLGELSQKYFRGGGHPCAAGGKLPQSRVDSIDNAIKCLKKVIG